jgi:hypothetical protein
MHALSRRRAVWLTALIVIAASGFPEPDSATAAEDWAWLVLSEFTDFDSSTEVENESGSVSPGAAADVFGGEAIRDFAPFLIGVDVNLSREDPTALASIEEFYRFSYGEPEDPVPFDDLDSASSTLSTWLEIPIQISSESGGALGIDLVELALSVSASWSLTIEGNADAEGSFGPQSVVSIGAFTDDGFHNFQNATSDAFGNTGVSQLPDPVSITRDVDPDGNFIVTYVNDFEVEIVTAMTIADPTVTFEDGMLSLQVDHVSMFTADGVRDVWMETRLDGTNTFVLNGITSLSPGFDVTVIPEPSTFLLLGLGLVALGSPRRFDAR